jgi:hypothetical protein
MTGHPANIAKERPPSCMEGNPWPGTLSYERLPERNTRIGNEEHVPHMLSLFPKHASVDVWASGVISIWHSERTFSVAVGAVYHIATPGERTATT